MVDGTEMKRRSGTVTVLALLVSFLFGYAPAAAQVSVDGSARLGSSELVKRGNVLRTSVRASQPDDQDADSVLLPPPPAIFTYVLSVRAVAAGSLPLPAAAPRLAPHFYRARAPPVA